MAPVSYTHLDVYKRQHGDWVNVSVHFDYGECRMYGEEGPILRLIHIEEGKKPQQELVTFT